uniref:Ig-like domain-containing protein n=1 Tax=Oryzias latipes TaxID=8090 RepID=A0A3P9LHC0_ORYLA
MPSLPQTVENTGVKRTWEPTAVKSTSLSQVGDPAFRTNLRTWWVFVSVWSTLEMYVAVFSGCDSYLGTKTLPVLFHVCFSAGSLILEAPVRPVTEGEDATLTCRCKDLIPACGYKANFYKDSVLIGSSFPGNMTITIQNVSRSDQGLYKCSASGLGESPESWMTVRGNERLKFEAKPFCDKNGRIDAESLMSSLRCSRGGVHGQETGGCRGVTCLQRPTAALRRPARRFLSRSHPPLSALTGSHTPSDRKAAALPGRSICLRLREADLSVTCRTCSSTPPSKGRRQMNQFSSFFEIPEAQKRTDQNKPVFGISAHTEHETTKGHEDRVGGGAPLSLYTPQMYNLI